MDNGRLKRLFKLTYSAIRSKIFIPNFGVRKTETANIIECKFVEHLKKNSHLSLYLSVIAFASQIHMYFALHKICRFDLLCSQYFYHK